VLVEEDWINSTKLLKLAQLYKVSCTVLLMAFTILGNLLIKKVFLMTISNIVDTVHCLGFFLDILEIGFILSSPMKFSTNLG